MPEGLQRASAPLQVLLPRVGQDKPSGASLHKEDAKVLFKSGQRPAHRRSWKLHLLCRSRQRARLCDCNKRTDIVEVQVLHRERFLFLPASGSNEINLRPAPFTIRNRDAADHRRAYHSIALVQLYIAPQVASKWFCEGHMNIKWRKAGMKADLRDVPA